LNWERAVSRAGEGADMIETGLLCRSIHDGLVKSPKKGPSRRGSSFRLYVLST
jgi:hypothetical protein